ncbi:MAG: hypothetical protein IJ062_11760 [Firmicutes bacterium]|nr:hypothetical protein [Bacillota bacterium]
MNKLISLLNKIFFKSVRRTLKKAETKTIIIVLAAMALIYVGFNFYMDYFRSGIAAEFIVDNAYTSTDYFYIKRKDGTEYLGFIRGYRKPNSALSDMQNCYDHIGVQSETPISKDEYKTLLASLKKVHSLVDPVERGYTYSAHDNDEYFIGYRGKFYSDNTIFETDRKFTEFYGNHPNAVTKFIYDTEHKIQQAAYENYYDIYSSADEILREKDHKYRYGS